MQMVRTLIRLGGCSDWFGSSVDARLVFSCSDSNVWRCIVLVKAFLSHIWWLRPTYPLQIIPLTRWDHVLSDMKWPDNYLHSENKDIRDESVITSWGGGGVRCVPLSCISSSIGGGGGQMCSTVMYFVKYWGGGGSDVFHWSFFSLKVIASGPLYPGIHPQLSITCRGQLCNVRLSEPLGDIGNKICPILVKQ